MTAHDTADDCPNHSMVLGNSTYHTANRGAFETPFRVRLGRQRPQRSAGGAVDSPVPVQLPGPRVRIDKVGR